VWIQLDVPNLRAVYKGHLKIKNYKFERAKIFKYSDNNHQIHLQERIKKW
jgi:hypothetical protein